jgi:hypothetical protein
MADWKNFISTRSTVALVALPVAQAAAFFGLLGATDANTFWAAALTGGSNILIAIVAIATFFRDPSDRADAAEAKERLRSMEKRIYALEQRFEKQ